MPQDSRPPGAPGPEPQPDPGPGRPRTQAEQQLAQLRAQYPGWSIWTVRYVGAAPGWHATPGHYPLQAASAAQLGQQVAASPEQRGLQAGAEAVADALLEAGITDHALRVALRVAERLAGPGGGPPAADPPADAQGPARGRNKFRLAVRGRLASAQVRRHLAQSARR